MSSAETEPFIVRSRFPDVDIPDMSVTDYVLRTAPGDADRVAIIDGVDGSVWTREALLEHAQRIAGGLHDRGISTGSTVALMAPNGPEFAAVFHAVLLTGATLTPVNPTYGVDETAYQLADAGADFVIATPMAHAVAAAAADHRPIAVFGEASFDALIGEPLGQQPRDYGSGAAVLPYSSGTTGLPKGVILTHRNLVANLVQSAAVSGYKEGHVGFLVIPMFHIYGMNGLMNSLLAEGVPFVTLPRFDLEKAVSLIAEHRVSDFFAVPPMVLALARHPLVDNYDLSSLRRVTCAAAPLGADLAAEASARLGCPIVQAFGMTELSPMSHITILPDVRLGSSGVAAPNTESLIVTADGQPLGVDDVGELLIRGPQVMAGYLNNPAATAASIDEDGWLHTGDLARIDSDGHLFIVGRVKELIKYNGFQVAPAELEALLIEHPDVADVAVIGMPDVECGERPTAFVVARPGHDVEPADIAEFVAGQVASYKRIHHVELVEAIPRSAAGKILRRELHALAAELRLAETLTGLR
jgi:acyl-CoA synthetase (AMP-forming)/AMP-acid ligase II